MSIKPTVCLNWEMSLYYKRDVKMKKKYKIIIYLLVILFIANASYAVDYQIIDLGVISGNFSRPSAINDKGQVVGVDSNGNWDYRQAFLWENGSGMRSLGTLGGNYSMAFGINNSGQTVGYAATPSGANHAFLWSGGMQDLGIDDNSYALDINDIGQVVGNYGGNYRYAFLWDSTNGVQTLSSLYSGFSYANGINNSGQIVGEGYIGAVDSWHAVLMDGNGYTDLGTLGGRSSASKINDNGQVVGSSSTLNGEIYSFLCDSRNGMQNLGTLSGNSWALDINNNGQEEFTQLENIAIIMLLFGTVSTVCKT